jgi:hypothetical protein
MIHKTIYTSEMLRPFNLNSEAVERSFAETVRWCVALEISISAEDVRNTSCRDRLFTEANSSRLSIADKSRPRWKWLRQRRPETKLEWRRSVTDIMSKACSIPFATFSYQLRTPEFMSDESLGKVLGREKEERIVNTAIAKRSERLTRLSGSEIPQTSNDGGRLLLYSPEENVADGASQHASAGFFDVYDTPPWDTWVSYSDGTLLSWVPPQLVGMVQRGIDVNPVDCIRWLT